MLHFSFIFFAEAQAGILWVLHTWVKRLEKHCFDQLEKQTYDRNRLKGFIVCVRDMVSTQYNFVIPCNLRLSQNSNKQKTESSPFEKSRAVQKSPFGHVSSSSHFSTQWKAVRTCLLVMRLPPQTPPLSSTSRTILRFALSYNPEIGLHNTKDISALGCTKKKTIFDNLTIFEILTIFDNFDFFLKFAIC